MPPVVSPSMTADELRNLLKLDPEHAAETVQGLGNQGLLAAQILFGQMLLEGKGTIRSRAAALAWFELAGKQGSAEAINMVGRCLENGWGTEPDVTQALACYVYAAKLGHDWAQYNVARMYFDGAGVEPDAERAAHWYAQAANQGHARSMNRLARCYEQGWGVVQNQSRATDWYRRSAEAGYFRGQYNWATALVRAGKVDEAANWLIRASQEATTQLKKAIASYAAQIDHSAMRAVASSLNEALRAVDASK
jgi:TPR repeat protein